MNAMVAEVLHGAGLHDLAYQLDDGSLAGGKHDMLRPIFCRIGSKYALRNKIVPLIPEHTTYVEPFAGSSAIFFSKPKATYNVLNDLDRDTIAQLRLLQHAPDALDAYPDATGINQHKALWSKPQRTTGQKIAHNIIRTCSGFSGAEVKQPKNIYRGPSIHRKVHRVAEYKDRLRGVDLTSQDYAKVIQDNDGAGTFVFLDPPYENSEKRMGYAEHKDFDFERLVKTLKGIKGKFLMTINDSPRIRELFKGFNIKPFVADTNLRGVNVTSKNAKNFGEYKPYTRKELFISNYRLPART
jgi:DNA adenine methylase